jgi:hypothetical protein
MNLTECKAWVDKHIYDYSKQFGLELWKLTVLYERIYDDDGGEIYGSCRADYNYQRALIKLNYLEIETENQLAEILEHELLHIMHSPFSEMWDVIKATISNQEALTAISVMWIGANEKTVRMLEHMRNGHARVVFESLAAGVLPDKARGWPHCGCGPDPLKCQCREKVSLCRES